jgi:hypothetical protein
VRHVLKKKKKHLIKATKIKHYMTEFKFKVFLPQTMEDIKQFFDKEDKTMKWREAIDQELNNVCIAFDFKEE